LTEALTEACGKWLASLHSVFMPLSWNEIRHRAIAFSKEWKGIVSKAGERQTFWNEFFKVFGVRCRVVATYKEPVKKFTNSCR
jgi:hypothetical protein